MINSSRKLAGKTLFITGASRGIGKAIALKAASDGANIVIAAKTADPHPKLPGTIYSAAEEVEKAGGKALPCIVDVRDETQVKNAVKAAVEKFGGIDILINNASAISLTSTQNTDMKRYDLMNSINTRGTFLLSKECLPFLQKSNHAHILNISPPLNMSPKWFSNHVAYTIAKYGMSMCALGMALELKDKKIAVNALWPRTAIHTAAIEMLTGPESSKWSRKPEIMADAAYAILCRSPDVCTGNFFIDETVLQEEGIKNFTNYACDPANADKLMTDFFLDAEEIPEEKVENVTHSSQKEEGVNKIFASITKLLNEDLVKKVNSVYQFNLHGEQKGVWFVDLKTGAGTCGKGEAIIKPDAVLSMDSRNFFEMFTGKLKPANAFLSGKLKISGDLQKAMKLEKLMVGLKSKM